MERLTKRINGYAHGAEGQSDEQLSGNYCRGEFEATACIDRLASYEDTEFTPEQLAKAAELLKAKEEGRLIELPCKVGDTVYEPDFGYLYELYSWTIRDVSVQGFKYADDWVKWKALGKTVFLSPEEAEAGWEEAEK